jgi:hypothetical protein
VCACIYAHQSAYKRGEFNMQAGLHETVIAGSLCIHIHGSRAYSNYYVPPKRIVVGAIADILMHGFRAARRKGTAQSTFGKEHDNSMDLNDGAHTGLQH